MKKKRKDTSAGAIALCGRRPTSLWCTRLRLTFLQETAALLFVDVCCMSPSNSFSAPSLPVQKRPTRSMNVGAVPSPAGGRAEVVIVDAGGLVGRAVRYVF